MLVNRSHDHCTYKIKEAVRKHKLKQKSPACKNLGSNVQYFFLNISLRDEEQLYSSYIDIIILMWTEIQPRHPSYSALKITNHLHKAKGLLIRQHL